MKKKILFVLCLLFGLMFLNAGLNKFFNYMPTPPDLPEAQVNMFMAMVQIGWLLALIGIAEIAGGILFMIPRFRALGVLILAPVLSGILLAHLIVAPEGLPIVAVLLAIYTWVIIENRKKFLPIVSPNTAAL